MLLTTRSAVSVRGWFDRVCSEMTADPRPDPSGPVNCRTTGQDRKVRLMSIRPHPLRSVRFVPLVCNDARRSRRWPALSGEGLDQRSIEGLQVVRLAARDERVTGLRADDNFTILPVAACIADVGLQARPAGQILADHYAGLDEG